MNEFLQQLSLIGNTTKSFTLVDVVLIIFLTLISGIIISQTYKNTYKGISYSQSFAQTIVIMEITAAIIILVIGSNIALAFGLVGTLSIIRFRTSVKDPKDVAFIFFAMGSGMAFGIRLYVEGMLFTVLLSLIIFALFYFDFGRKKDANKILKIRVPQDTSIEKIQSILINYKLKFYLVSRDNITDDLLEFVYVIKNNKKSSLDRLTEDIKAIDKSIKVTIYEERQELEM